MLYKKTHKRIFSTLLLVTTLLTAACSNNSGPGIYTTDDLLSKEEIIKYVDKEVTEPHELVSIQDRLDPEQYPQQVYTFKSTERDLTFVVESYLYYTYGPNSKSFGAIPDKTWPTYMSEITKRHQSDLDGIVNTYQGDVKDWFAEKQLNIDYPTGFTTAEIRPAKLFLVKTPEDVEKFAAICVECDKLFSEENAYNGNGQNIFGKENHIVYYEMSCNTEQTSYTYIIELTGLNRLTIEDIMIEYLDHIGSKDIPNYEAYLKDRFGFVKEE